MSYWMKKTKIKCEGQTGVKKKFNIIRDKKSIIIIAFVSIFFLFPMHKDEKKLKHSRIIISWSLKIEYSKILKFKILNISYVSFLLNNNGARITDDPFKKNKHSDKKNFFLKENIVSSFPKW